MFYLTCFPLINPQTETMRALTDEKEHTIRLMLEQERRNVEQLRQEMAQLQQQAPASTRQRQQLDLEAAVKRMAVLQEQLEGIRSSKVGGCHAFRFILLDCDKFMCV